jgi:aprataxin
LLSGDKETAKEVIEGLAEDAKQVKKDIEDEMLNKYGFKWEVWTGFHGAPSMAYV